MAQSFTSGSLEPLETYATDPTGSDSNMVIAVCIGAFCDATGRSWEVTNPNPRVAHAIRAGARVAADHIREGMDAGEDAHHE
jgi:hypothetical protein